MKFKPRLLLFIPILYASYRIATEFNSDMYREPIALAVIIYVSLLLYLVDMFNEDMKKFREDLDELADLCIGG